MASFLPVILMVKMATGGKTDASGYSLPSEERKEDGKEGQEQERAEPHADGSRSGPVAAAWVPRGSDNTRDKTAHSRRSTSTRSQTKKHYSGNNGHLTSVFWAPKSEQRRNKSHPDPLSADGGRASPGAASARWPHPGLTVATFPPKHLRSYKEAGQQRHQGHAV